MGRLRVPGGRLVLSTPPNSGTTWSQAILIMLIHGRAVSDRRVWCDSIWLDCGFRDRDAAEAADAAQTHRRCTKSHTPFDGIAHDPSAARISFSRHPIDVHFSLERHVGNSRFDFLDRLFPDEPAAAFDRFINGGRPIRGRAT